MAANVQRALAQVAENEKNLREQKRDVRDARRRNRAEQRKVGDRIGETRNGLVTLRGRLANKRKQAYDVSTQEAKERAKIRKKQAEWNKQKAENLAKFKKIGSDTEIMKQWELWGNQNNLYWFFRKTRDEIDKKDREFNKNFARLMRKISLAWDRALKPDEPVPMKKFTGLYFIEPGGFDAKPPTMEKIISLNKSLDKLLKQLADFEKTAKIEDLKFERAFLEIGANADKARLQAWDAVREQEKQIEQLREDLGRLVNHGKYLEGREEEFDRAVEQIEANWRQVQNKKAQIYQYIRATRAARRR